MPTTTPRRVAQTATRVCITASVVDVILVAAWGAQLWTARPYLTLMAFAALLGVATASGVVMATARCHLSIAQAFSAGATVGRSAPPPGVSAAPRAALRVVD